MRDNGLQGVIGKSVRTAISDKAAHARWIPSAASSTRHGRTSFDSPTSTMSQPGSGFVYVAFVINAYARRIVGWRSSRTAHADFVLNALEQALHDRQPAHRSGHMHHSDRGKYVSISTPSAWLKLGGILLSAVSFILRARHCADRDDLTAGSTSSCIPPKSRTSLAM